VWVTALTTTTMPTTLTVGVVPYRGCKPKPQKIPMGVERARIFPTKEFFGKVSGRSPRQIRTLIPLDAARQASFSGKSIYGASSADRGTSASIGVYR
jgi:hypothetical protein